jgi:hypothetical protein
VEVGGGGGRAKSLCEIEREREEDLRKEISHAFAVDAPGAFSRPVRG